jgi:enolase
LANARAGASTKKMPLY